MSNLSNYPGLTVDISNYIATIEINLPPYNFFNLDLINKLVEIFSVLDQSADCRVIVLASAGKVFCAGADFGSDGSGADGSQAKTLYDRAVNLFAVSKPVIVAVQGAVIGGGLGLALVGDFRVTCDQARFSANFTRLGIHPGFGLSETLPNLIGKTKAALMFYTGRRISGAEAYAMGLADILVEVDQVRHAAIVLAQEIALSAPQAVKDTRATLRQGLIERVRAATHREQSCQAVHMQMDDFKEGVAATRERREPHFTGQLPSSQEKSPVT